LVEEVLHFSDRNLQDGQHAVMAELGAIVLFKGGALSQVDATIRY